MSKDDIFGEVISEYSDEQAIDDGVLIDISTLNLKIHAHKVDRMTSNLLNSIHPIIADEPDELKKYLADKCSFAAQPDGGDGYIYHLPAGIWAVQNKRKNYTLMLPEDY